MAGRGDAVGPDAADERGDHRNSLRLTCTVVPSPQATIAQRPAACASRLVEAVWNSGGGAPAGAAMRRKRPPVASAACQPRLVAQTTSVRPRERASGVGSTAGAVLSACTRPSAAIARTGAEREKLLI